MNKKLNDDIGLDLDIADRTVDFRSYNDTSVFNPAEIELKLLRESVQRIIDHMNPLTGIGYMEAGSPIHAELLHSMRQYSRRPSPPKYLRFISHKDFGNRRVQEYVPEFEMYELDRTTFLETVESHPIKTQEKKDEMIQNYLDYNVNHRIQLECKKCYSENSPETAEYLRELKSFAMASINYLIMGGLIENSSIDFDLRIVHFQKGDFRVKVFHKDWYRNGKKEIEYQFKHNNRRSL